MEVLDGILAIPGLEEPAKADWVGVQSERKFNPGVQVKSNKDFGSEAVETARWRAV